MFCNYLFFKGYELGIKTKSFDDYPILAGAAVIAMWFVFNFGTLLLLVSHYFNYSFSINRYLGAFILFNGCIFYYSFGGRGKKIIRKCEDKRASSLIYGLNPYIAVFGSLLLSAAVFIFVGSYISDLKIK